MSNTCPGPSHAAWSSCHAYQSIFKVDCSGGDTFFREFFSKPFLSSCSWNSPVLVQKYLADILRNLLCTVTAVSLLNSVWSFLPFSFFFLNFKPNLWHMEVPGLGVKLELQVLAYATAMATGKSSHICDLRWSLRQCQGSNPHPHRENVRSLTNCAPRKLLYLF